MELVYTEFMPRKEVHDPGGCSLDLELDDGLAKCVEATLVCGPPNHKLQLNLSNSGTLPLGFKAMTNAPRRWSVKPNGGVVEPGGSVQIVLSLVTARANDSFANDHHLILSVPLQPEEAARLAQLRAENGQVSIEALTQDNPRVSQARLSAQLPPPSLDRSLGTVAEIPNGVHSADEEAESPARLKPQPESPGGNGANDRSVAERVKDLQRKYAGGEDARAAPPPARRSGPPAGAPLALETVAEEPAPGTPAQHGAASPAEAGAEADAEAAPRFALMRRHPLLRWLAEQLEAALDEFEPWLKWKARRRQVDRPARPGLDAPNSPPHPGSRG